MCICQSQTPSLSLLPSVILLLFLKMFICSLFKILHISYITWYFSFCVWLTSLSMTVLGLSIYNSFKLFSCIAPLNELQIPLPHKFHGHFDFGLVCRLTWRELVSSQHCLLRQECSLSPFTQADLIECFNVSFSEKAMAPHSSTLAWKIRWTGGAWWSAVYGVAKSQTRLSDWTELSALSNIFNVYF